MALGDGIGYKGNYYKMVNPVKIPGFLITKIFLIKSLSIENFYDRLTV